MHGSVVNDRVGQAVYVQGTTGFSRHGFQASVDHLNSYPLSWSQTQSIFNKLYYIQTTNIINTYYETAVNVGKHLRIE